LAQHGSQDPTHETCGLKEKKIFKSKQRLKSKREIVHDLFVCVRKGAKTQALVGHKRVQSGAKEHAYMAPN